MDLGDNGPLYVYLAVTVLTAIIYYAYGYYKGKGFPGMSALSSQFCSIAICACIIMCCTKFSSIGAWLCVALCACLGIANMVNYISTGGDAFQATLKTIF